MLFSLPIVLVTGAVCATLLLLDASLDVALAKWGKRWARFKRDFNEQWEAQVRQVAPLVALALVGLVATLAITFARISSATVVHTTKITAHFPFTTTGHTTWGIANAPTIDCPGDLYTGSTTWPCTGTTLTKTGTPTVNPQTSVPFRPQGFTVACTGCHVNSSGPLLNGSTDYFTGGTSAGITGEFTVCAAFRTTSVTGVHEIFVKDDGATNREFALDINGATARLTVWKGGGTGSSSISSAASSIGINNTHVVCASYDFVADGSSTLRMNLDGTDVTAVTNSVGPIVSGTATLEIGTNATGSNLWSGLISDVVRWDGFIASQAQLKQMVLTYWGLVGDGGQQVSVTRATTETCQIGGTSGPIFSMPNNVACVNDNGLQVFAASTNLVIRNQQFDNGDWTAVNVTVTADQAASLRDAAGNVADKLVTTSAGGYVYNGGTAGAASLYSASIYAQTLSGTQAAAIRVADVKGTTAAAWVANNPYAANSYVVPTVSNNHFYKWISAGPCTSAASEPGTWCTTSGCTVTDNTCTWTEQGLVTLCTGTFTAKTTWDRYSCSTSVNAVTTNTLSAFIYPGGTAGSGTIIVDGAQLEALGQPTPVIWTAGGTATRNAGLVTLPTGPYADPEGEICATPAFPATWVSTGTDMVILGAGVSGYLYAGSATLLSAYDGTNVVSSTQTSFVGRSPRVCIGWNGTAMSSKEVGGASNVGSYDGTVVGTPTVGMRSNTTLHINAYVSDLRVCRSSEGCE